MAKGLKPNMKDTYGIEVQTDMNDQMLPYLIRIRREDGTIVASYGATDVYELIASLTYEIRNSVYTNRGK